MHHDNPSGRHRRSPCPPVGEHGAPAYSTDGKGPGSIQPIRIRPARGSVPFGRPTRITAGGSRRADHGGRGTARGSQCSDHALSGQPGRVGLDRSARLCTCRNDPRGPERSGPEQWTQSNRREQWAGIITARLRPWHITVSSSSASTSLTARRAPIPARSGVVPPRWHGSASGRAPKPGPIRRGAR